MRMSIFTRIFYFSESFAVLDIVVIYLSAITLSPEENDFPFPSPLVFIAGTYVNFKAFL